MRFCLKKKRNWGCSNLLSRPFIAVTKYLDIANSRRFSEVSVHISWLHWLWDSKHHSSKITWQNRSSHGREEGQTKKWTWDQIEPSLSCPQSSLSRQVSNYEVFTPPKTGSSTWEKMFNIWTCGGIVHVIPRMVCEHALQRQDNNSWYPKFNFQSFMKFQLHSCEFAAPFDFIYVQTSFVLLVQGLM